MLIAVGQGAIKDSDLHDMHHPLMAKAVFPIGEPVWMVPIGDGRQKTRVEVPRREEITKSNGAVVKTTLFLDPASSPLSGVMYARDHVHNLAWDAERDLGLIHNPSATTPLARGSIAACCEMWCTPRGILRHRGVCSRYGSYAKAR
ncbi:MAG: hypothetical protein EOP08_01455 [Proteobacteria bacterium]|nr:MAG: hypothetical protein EOP08_01455 [Pseudomonadota bacterium]